MTQSEKSVLDVGANNNSGSQNPKLTTTNPPQAPVPVTSSFGPAVGEVDGAGASLGVMVEQPVTTKAAEQTHNPIRTFLLRSPALYAGPFMLCAQFRYPAS
jgi:hypothetical protein